MPQNTSITILDGAATPVSQVFSPSAISAALAEWKNRAQSSLIGQPTITSGLRVPNRNAPTYKTTIKLTLPKVITTTDTTGKTVTSVDYTNVVSIDLVCSERSTEQERKDLRVQASNLLKDAIIVAMVDKAEGVW